MLTYSKGHKISLNLTLVNNDGSPEENADVNYKIYNESYTMELSANNLPFNSQLGSYIDVINPKVDWPSQEEGIYFVKWEISSTVEEYPNEVTEELHIEKYDEKLDRLLGLMHENTYIDKPVYDKYDNLTQARMRIYSDSASVGTDNNVIGEYEIRANGTAVGKFSFWQQKRLDEE